jgi:hypothetical protein
MANMPILILLLTFGRSLFETQRQLVLDNLALRRQLTMLRQSVKHCSPWNETTKQPDTLDNPLPSQLPQALPPHHRPGVRQARRV